YEEQHRVDNMVLDLASCGDAPLKEPALPLVVGDRVDDEWLDALFELNAVSNADHLRVVPSMYAAIPKYEITVKVHDREGHVAGTGLGILDRGYVGVYAIHVREDCRRQGLAEAIVRTILTEGARQGATKAYLQVVSDNEPARRLYEKLGFVSEYECWFRVKESL
ncbi:MAG: GNAT family N-acetyltransferase, partial [Clostridia bacterium]|nr:GNAT family N-acetyltransferase [Clostridia bacterium]